MLFEPEEIEKIEKCYYYIGLKLPLAFFPKFKDELDRM